jgi:hypothetical protein
MSNPHDPLPPTDSVLRRHYDQLSAAAAAGTSAPPAPTARSAPTPPPAKPESQGVRGWFSRLFGG